MGFIIIYLDFYLFLFYHVHVAYRLEYIPTLFCFNSPSHYWWLIKCQTIIVVLIFHNIPKCSCPVLFMFFSWFLNNFLEIPFAWRNILQHIVSNLNKLKYYSVFYLKPPFPVIYLRGCLHFKDKFDREYLTMWWRIWDMLCRLPGDE